MRILMTGGTGLIGNAVGRRLARQHQLLVLSREGREARSRVSYPCELLQWDGVSDISPRWLEGVEGIIHLAGESIAVGKWSAARKEELRHSRIQTIEIIGRALKTYGRVPKVLISASAVGIYGDRGDEVLTEESNPGSGFLADLCVDWEKAAREAGARRTVILRFGVVMTPEGGFIKEILSKYKMFGASRLGSGRQYLSCIAIDDLVQILATSLTKPEFHGAFNVVAPEPVTNSEMTKILSAASGSFRAPPVPAFLLRLIFGEKADLFLSSQRVKPDRLLRMKWNFQYPSFEVFAKKFISKG